MKKPFLLVSAISAVVVFLLAGSIVQAAPIISVEKSVDEDNDGLNANTGDEVTGPIFDEGDTIYFVYEYTIENTSENEVTYTYIITDTDTSVADISGTTEPVAAGGTVTGIAQITSQIAQPGQYSSTVTLSVTSDDEDPVPVTNDLHYYGVPPTETTIEFVDIKPGSDPNSINLHSQGVVPVALIDFDPALLDGLTITFAGAEALRWADEDVDGDGDDDVICHFRTQDLVELNGDSTDAVVHIGTWDDTLEQYVGGYADEDSVNIVPKGEAKGHAKGSTSSSSNKGNNGNKGGNGKGRGKNK